MVVASLAKPVGLLEAHGHRKKKGVKRRTARSTRQHVFSLEASVNGHLKSAKLGISRCYNGLRLCDGGFWVADLVYYKVLSNRRALCKKIWPFPLSQLVSLGRAFDLCWLSGDFSGMVVVLRAMTSGNTYCYTGPVWGLL